MSSSLPSAPEEPKLRSETAPRHVRRILAATDFSKQATLAVRIAARLGKQLQSQLLVLYAEPLQIYAPGNSAAAPRLNEIDVDRPCRQLHEYAAKIPELRTIKHEEVVLNGPPAQMIQDIVEAREIDLVVVGSKGRGGFEKILLGSVAEAAIHGLHCPVLVAGPRCAEQYRSLASILFATDLSIHSLRAARYAKSLARQSGATLTVAHVLPAVAQKAAPSSETGEGKTMKELRQIVPADAGWEHPVHFKIARGEPAQGILRLAEDIKADVIVMGVSGHTSLASHVPWTVLSKVIRGAHCPVLAVQPRHA